MKYLILLFLIIYFGQNDAQNASCGCSKKHFQEMICDATWGIVMRITSIEKSGDEIKYGFNILSYDKVCKTTSNALNKERYLYTSSGPCGIQPLKIGEVYGITGHMDSNNRLISNQCDVVVPWAEIKYPRVLELVRNDYQMKGACDCKILVSNGTCCHPPNNNFCIWDTNNFAMSQFGFCKKIKGVCQWIISATTLHSYKSCIED